MSNGSIGLNLVSANEALGRIGEFIRLARQREELTQGDLASKAGVPASTISRLERCGLGSTESLLKILFALNQIDALDGFVRERLRLMKFPKTLSGFAGDQVSEVRRVRHRRRET